MPTRPTSPGSCTTWGSRTTPISTAGRSSGPSSSGARCGSAAAWSATPATSCSRRARTCRPAASSRTPTSTWPRTCSTGGRATSRRSSPTTRPATDGSCREGTCAGQVAALAAALRDAGAVPGDRVAAWLPNGPEAVVTMLAAASIGATFSSCSPDFGAVGVLDRFGQIEPVVLVAADGYHYNGQPIDCLERLREIRAALPSVRRTIVVPVLVPAPDLDGIDGAELWPERPRPSRRSDAGRGPAALRPSVVRALLVRHHGATEVHRPPDRRRAAEARGRTPAPVRRPAGRPRPLLHDDGLDDVELAGLGAGLRRHRRAVRRLTVRTRARPALRPGRRGGHQPARRLRQVPRRAGQGRPAPRPHPRPGQPAHHLLDGLTAGARGLPVRVRARQGRRAPGLHLRRHGSLRLPRRRRPHRAGLRRRDPAARPRHGHRRLVGGGPDRARR